MATDLKWIQGRISENPHQQRKDLDIFLNKFLQSLVEEQVGTSKNTEPSEHPSEPEICAGAV